MLPAKDDEPPPQGTPLPERGQLADYYRQKAEQCRRYAEAATDPSARDEWLMMANGWTQLALRSDR